jgi:hypothetical protein
MEHMTTCGQTGAERLVKSTDRVRDLGEVFTPAATVQSMLDLLPSEMWEVHPSSTFLEPACGDGNFLVAILARKLGRVAAALETGTLPAGPGMDALQFHALEALASIYAMDISPDNVAGANLFHGPGARDRMLTLIDEWWGDRIGRRPAVNSRLLAVARWIVDRNIQVANMLEFDGVGRPTKREIPLVDYMWNPVAQTVAVARTSLGAVMSAARSHTTGVMSLFDEAPAPAWIGPAARLDDAPVATPKVPKTSAGNGRG